MNEADLRRDWAEDQRGAVPSAVEQRDAREGAGRAGGSEAVVAQW